MIDDDSRVLLNRRLVELGLLRLRKDHRLHALRLAMLGLKTAHREDALDGGSVAQELLLVHLVQPRRATSHWKNLVQGRLLHDLKPSPHQGRATSKRLLNGKVASKCRRDVVALVVDCEVVEVLHPNQAVDETRGVRCEVALAREAPFRAADANLWASPLEQLLPHLVGDTLLARGDEGRFKVLDRDRFVRAAPIVVELTRDGSNLTSILDSSPLKNRLNPTLG